jgi:hypothetical protein
MKHEAFFVVLVLAFSSANALSEQNSGEVGYCAGPPCCTYEGTACSAEDNAALVYKSRIVDGQEAFCSKLMASRWTYLPLDHSHTVSQEEVQAYLRIRGGTPSMESNVGYFDINNDGKPEYLGWIQLYSGAGSGCDVEIFVELDDQRAHIRRSQLSSLLAATTCRDYNRAFVFDGRTYIENRKTVDAPYLHYSLPSVLTEVFIIEGHSRRSVCKYHLNE